ncbi:MAG: hypothetical protein AAFU34_06575 [Pseudomonadota bacterium]
MALDERLFAKIIHDAQGIRDSPQTGAVNFHQGGVGVPAAIANRRRTTPTSSRERLGAMAEEGIDCRWLGAVRRGRTDFRRRSDDPIMDEVALSHLRFFIMIGAPNN